MFAVESCLMFWLPDRLTCTICLSVVQWPHVVSCCGNQFCESCILPIVKGAGACPLCNSPSFTTFLHKGVEREVRSLKIFCPNESLGCEWKGELGSLDAHTALALGAVEWKGFCGYALFSAPTTVGRKYSGETWDSTSLNRALSFTQQHNKYWRNSKFYRASFLSKRKK